MWAGPVNVMSYFPSLHADVLFVNQFVLELVCFQERGGMHFETAFENWIENIKVSFFLLFCFSWDPGWLYRDAMDEEKEFLKTRKLPSLGQSRKKTADLGKWVFLHWQYRGPSKKRQKLPFEIRAQVWEKSGLERDLTVEVVVRNGGQCLGRAGGMEFFFLNFF